MQSLNFTKGNPTKVTSSVSETRYTKFDNYGRLTESEQRTPVGIETVGEAQARISKYEYNLSGALVKQTYPNGREVRNAFESDGDLSRVYGQANANAAIRTYANSFSFTASGGISQMKLGNGRWETAKFNERLQVTELGLGNSSSDVSIWKLNYEFGELNADGTTVNPAKNTRNIAKQTISFSGLAYPLVQTYKYDSLYRLTEARETSNNQQTWIQQFGYDRYGNRTAFNHEITGIQQISQTLEVNPQTNRFTSSNYAYDFNGNIITDVSNANEKRDYIFNGDNKQIEIKDINGATIGRYFYDGEGRRVKKVTNLETTVFVYDGIGKLIAEYSTDVSQTPQTKYLTEDHLGTPRIITDATGQVIARRDFLPFGEDLFAGVGARSSAQKYGATQDDIRQKFTGYQKDKETGLDFAEARMYENRFGRFTAVDPLLASGKSANPQTFNRYSYTSNNPIIRIDVNGKDWITVIQLVKVKKTVKTKGGKTKTVERTVEVETPLWVTRDEYEGQPRISGVWEVNFGEKGFQALHPTENRSSDLFKTREEAQSVYEGWMKETLANDGNFNPRIQLAIFESTWYSGADGAAFKGIPGHVAWGINNRPWSWDNTGYEGSQQLYSTFSDYLNYNFTYRSGTVYDLDFGSPYQNRLAAQEIMLGPRNNASPVTIFSSGYNLISNNCGESIRRVSERLSLPTNNAIAPWSHQTYVEGNWRQQIIRQQRFGPALQGPPPFTREINFNRGSTFRF